MHVFTVERHALEQQLKRQRIAHAIEIPPFGGIKHSIYNSITGLIYIIGRYLGFY